MMSFNQPRNYKHFNKKMDDEHLTCLNRDLRQKKSRGEDERQLYASSM